VQLKEITAAKPKPCAQQPNIVSSAKSKEIQGIHHHQKAKKQPTPPK
jgi:uncharacterized protein (DUF1499 family)